MSLFSGFSSFRCQLLVVCLVLPISWSSARGDEPAFVFVSRELAAEPDPAARNSAIERAAAGRLLLRDSEGSVEALIDATAPEAPANAPVDVMDPDVSYDGERIVFAGFSSEESAWRIFEINADGTDLRQITRSDRQVDLTRYGEAATLLEGYDDVDPCYLPDGRICFVSTRYAGIAPDGRRRATNLYVVNADGGDLHRITTERFGADTPAVEPSTGRIVYSRWWRSTQIVKSRNADGQIGAPPRDDAANGAEGAGDVPPGSPGYGVVVTPDVTDLPLTGLDESEFPGINSWFLAGIDPDGTDLAMWSGFRLDRELTQAYRPSFLADGRALALFIPETPFLGYPRGNGLRIFEQGLTSPELLGGPQEFEQAVTPELVYASATALPGGSVLVTAAVPVSLENAVDPDGNDPGNKPELVAADYGVYVLSSVDAAPELIYDESGTSELDAVPLVARQVPPIVEETATDRMSEQAPRTVEEAFELGGSFTFTVENIHFNSPVDVAIPNAPPVGQNLSIEFFMNPQRTSPAAGDTPILIHSVEIPANGKVEVQLPAGVPLFEVLRRPGGDLPVGRDGQIFHVGGFNFGRAGEQGRCVGCHAGHSMLPVPADTSWTNLAPSALVRTSSVRRPPQNTPLQVFLPGNLVDRRTDLMISEWSSVRVDREPRVELEWGASLRGREAILWGTRPGEGPIGRRDQRITGAAIELFLGGEVVQTISVNEEISPEGTRVPLNSEIEFDRFAVTIPRNEVSGYYEGLHGVALAEIEVVAQAATTGNARFVRGDADCNRQVDISDAITTLGHLFLGRNPTLCCADAADVNNDGVLNVTDPIVSLSAMFLGIGPDGDVRFPGECETSSGSTLGCNQSSPFCF